MAIIFKKDYQGKKFYQYEWNLIKEKYNNSENSLSIVRAEKLGKHIIKAYGISFMPEILYTNQELASVEDNYMAYFDPKSNTLKFGKGGHNVCIFLHEMSHFICHIYFGCSVSSHGKEYVGIHANLFNKYLKIPYHVMYRKMDEDKIKYFRYDDENGVPIIL